jgi:RNA polymerase sigma-70 factor (ECF subfamily)
MDSQPFDAARTHASLFERIRGNADQEAWNEFYERYAPMIRGWCRHWFPHEVDDMAHEVFIRLMSCMKAFEYKPQEGRFRAYLKTMTHRMMAELKERVARIPVVSNEEMLIESEVRQDLWDRLASEYDLELLEQAKEIVRGRVEPSTWLAYLRTAEEWRKPADVARELGMRVGAVFQAKCSVIKQLRREVQILHGPPSDEVSS